MLLDFTLKHCFPFPDRDARYTKWKMAVQRSLGWATTKKSITMTGQKRKASMRDNLHSSSPPDSRKSSVNSDILIEHTSTVSAQDLDDLAKYSARKFSIFVPPKVSKQERTIVDDAEHFINKKECEYGMCQCCQVEKKILTNWESIEEIIENDPEIIFDSDDNPIMVESNLQAGSIPLDSIGGANTSKRVSYEKLPDLIKNICGKFSDSSLT